MSERYKGIYRGQSFRLQNWDYSSEGLYFITICTQNKEHYFGEVENEEMKLSEIGEIVQSEWLKGPTIRPDMNLELGEFIVMPNHFHGLIYIGSNMGNRNYELKYKNQFGPQSKNLSAIIRGFKSSVTTWCRKNKIADFKWQISFHDHIIQNKESFEKIQKYIIENAENWEKDKFYK